MADCWRVAAPLKEGRPRSPGTIVITLPLGRKLRRGTLTVVRLLVILCVLALVMRIPIPGGGGQGEGVRKGAGAGAGAGAEGSHHETHRVLSGDDIPGTAISISVSTPASKRNPHLEAALASVLSLLPDERTMNSLLRPIFETGEPRLRELGLRSREYKRYLEAWEALHLVSSASSDDKIYTRDDVIPYLRAHPEPCETSLADTLRKYEAFRAFLAQLADLLFPWTAPYFADHMRLHTHLYTGGRGIVLSCGDNQAAYVKTSIASFRRLGCTLPIEILYLGESDLGSDQRMELEQLPGVITRDMSQMVNDRGWKLAGWASKPFAILLSSFREAIFIDADALFFRDPAVLFDEPQYIETGALFFRDRIIMPESKKDWLLKVLPAPVSTKARKSRYWTGESGHMQESGVVVVDKWRHFLALLLVTRMNGPDRDGDKEKGIVGVYDMVYGDKETFWLAWELVGDLDYAFHDGDAGIIGTVQTPSQIAERYRQKHLDLPPHFNLSAALDTPQNYTICAPQLLHLDTSNRPLWFNGWILSNKFAESNAKVGGRFEVYLKEPTDGRRDPDPWQLEESNACCLTADETYEFTGEELAALDMIVGIAKEVGAWGKGE